MLVERIIGFDKSDKKAVAFAKEYLKIFNTPYTLKHNKLRINFVINGEDQIICEMIADILLIFFKYNELRKFLPEFKSIAAAAYAGAVMSIDREGERKALLEKITGRNEIVTVDGFYNFCLFEYHDVWKNLAKLASKLYGQCKNDEELYELTMFMLGIDGEGQSVVVIDNSEELRVRKNKTLLPIAKLFENDEMNIISTVLMYHPQNIIITKPDRLSKPLMAAIKTLGE